MWVRKVSRVDVSIRAAGVDVGIRHGWLSVGAPHCDPMVTMVDTERVGRFLMANGTPPGTLCMIGDAFGHLLGGCSVRRLVPSPSWCRHSSQSWLMG